MKIIRRPVVSFIAFLFCFTLIIAVFCIFIQAKKMNKIKDIFQKNDGNALWDVLVERKWKYANDGLGKNIKETSSDQTINYLYENIYAAQYWEDKEKYRRLFLIMLKEDDYFIRNKQKVNEMFDRAIAGNDIETISDILIFYSSLFPLKDADGSIVENCLKVSDALFRERVFDLLVLSYYKREHLLAMAQSVSDDTLKFNIRIVSKLLKKEKSDKDKKYLEELLAGLSQIANDRKSEN